MRSRLALKLAVLFIMGTLFFVPLLVIGVIGNERRQYHDEAIADIARSNAGAQCVTGPLIVWPYRVRHVTREREAASGRVVESESVTDEQLVLMPDSFDVQARLGLQTRRRGIYASRLFSTRVAVRGTFVIPPPPVPVDGSIVSWGDARMVVGISDTRGMREPPVLAWQDTVRRCDPGTGHAWTGPGFSAALGLGAPPAAARAASFALDLPLVGTQSFRVVPVGRRSVVRLESAWPHPSFSGRFLPDERTVTDRGFTAGWRLSRFATGVEDILATLATQAGTGESASGTSARDGGPLERVAFGVEFLDPVDAYRLTERALKYGMLFVLLTFLAFFMMEVLRGLDVHPMQYGLVGGALSIFFLLLLSLSEHMPYLPAYLIASLACVAPITAYVRHVLGGVERALGLGAGLALLYALLYVVMQSQDYALLLGSALLFAVLAYVMIATRRVDWSRMGEPPAARP